MEDRLRRLGGEARTFVPLNERATVPFVDLTAVAGARRADDRLRSSLCFGLHP